MADAPGAFTRLGAPLGMSQANYVLAAVCKRQGRADEAMQCAQRGLEIARSAGLPTPKGWLLNVWALNVWALTVRSPTPYRHAL